MASRRVHVVLHISAEEIQNYYAGAARNVATSAIDGRSIRFPANILRPYVMHNGVHGLFEIEFDENNRFVAIKRLDQSS